MSQVNILEISSKGAADGRDDPIHKLQSEKWSSRGHAAISVHRITLAMALVPFSWLNLAEKRCSG